MHCPNCGKELKDLQKFCGGCGSDVSSLWPTLVFGFFNTLRVQNAALAYAFPDALGWLTKIPSHFFSALPFIITLIVLIASSLSSKKKSGEPQAIGRNYYREDR